MLSAALAAGMIVGGTSTSIAMPRPCQPIAKADHVHPSAGDASGHGWWEEGTCNSAGATVGIALWMLWTSDGRWHEMASNIRGGIRPGGGSGGNTGRVTARAHCKDSSKRTWYSVATVVVTGGDDEFTSAKQSIGCRA
jgi:hypothetical protein